MFQLLVHTLVACTTFLAWGSFGMALLVSFWQEYRGKENTLGLRRKKRAFISCSSAIILLSLWIASPIASILLNILLVLTSGHLFHQSLLHQILKRETEFHIFPNNRYRTVTHKEVEPDREESEEETETGAEGEATVIFPEEQARRIHLVLDSPGFLYNPDISLNRLAREVAVNTTYLSRYFNRQLGKSFPEYITDRRLDKAEELLKNTDMKVVDIFEQVGFQNPSTFYLVFNERHQLSPLQWRESLRND